MKLTGRVSKYLAHHLFVPFGLMCLWQKDTSNLGSSSRSLDTRKKTYHAEDVREKGVKSSQKKSKGDKMDEQST